MTVRRACAFVAILAATLLTGGGAAAAPPPLTVYVGGTDTRTALRLQPGFATVVRADSRIDAVAIGDPRLVTATPVKHGQDVFDVILQPQVDAGVTNMVVWFGDVTSVWDLTIASGLRTADVVYVVTRPHSAVSAPTAGTAATAPQLSPAATPPAAPPADRPHTAATGPAAGAPSLLEVSQTVGAVSAVFQISRAADRVSIHYSVTNNGTTDLAIRPAGVLVRVNGALVPYAMARGSVDRGRPGIVTHGATEHGVIEASGRGARSVQLTLSLFPTAAGAQISYASVPITFEPLFTEIDQLAATP
jgi:hypothetical protein